MRAADHENRIARSPPQEDPDPPPDQPATRLSEAELDEVIADERLAANEAIEG